MQVIAKEVVTTGAGTVTHVRCIKLMTRIIFLWDLDTLKFMKQIMFLWAIAHILNPSGIQNSLFVPI